jgi:cyclophilin family peptidyl-prolyl cis-trans isomerase
MRKADECAAEPEPEVSGEEGGSAALNKNERMQGLNMMSAMYAEWGHLDEAVDCAARIRALGGPTALVEHETRVRCETTQGDFDMSLWRMLASIGFDNFMTLLDGDFYRDSGVYRVTDKLAQWGFNSDPHTQAKHVRKFKGLDDDYSVETPMDRGVISYFGHGGKSRHTSVFIAKKYMPPELSPSMMDAGKDQWMRAFGKVTKGMDVVDMLYSGYGEVEQEGQKDGEAGPNMLQIQLSGNKYLKKNFPKLDYIKTCYTILPSGETTKHSQKSDLYKAPEANPTMADSSGNAGIAE